MSYTDKGVLIFEEWFNAMEILAPKDYKALMTSMYRYQMKGEKPPEFHGKSAIVASLIFPYIDRRLAQAKGGKKGMENRYVSSGVNPVIDELLNRKNVKEVDN